MRRSLTTSPVRYVELDGVLLPVISGADGDTNADRLAEIVAQLADADQVAALTDDELVELEAELVALYDTARAERNLDAGTQANDALGLIRAQQTTRSDEAAAVEARFAELDAAVHGEDPDPEPGEGGEGSDDPDPDETGESTGGGNDPPAPAEAELEPVLAGGAPTPPTNAELAAAVNRRQHAQAKRGRDPRDAFPAMGAKVTARNGAKVKTTKDLIEAFTSTHEAMGSTYGGAVENVRVVQFSWKDSFPAERRIEPGADAARTSARLDAGLNPGALVAAGGRCAPLPVAYDLLFQGNDQRYMPANFPRFGADRGGLQWMPPPTLPSILADQTGGALTAVTYTEDAADKAKTCQEVACPSAVSAEVIALAQCLTFRNVGSRIWPEMMQNFIDLTAVAAARYADAKLLAQIDAQSTNVAITAPTLGAARTVIGGLRRAARALRQRHRLAPGIQITWLYPEWLLDVMVEDVANSLAHEVNQLGVARATVLGWLREAGINPVSFIDGVNDVQTMALTQGGSVGGFTASAELLAYPGTAQTWLFTEGSWVYFDGGELNLGIVRDSTLNAANKFQTFGEFWEVMGYRGFESISLRFDVCASGASAGSVTPATCAS